ncbi:transcriptional regulator [Mesorhizobium tamadayense]|uniref:Transcriptional regulator n=1 Tax=Mesorhizobium tamadayense TaxID=425306 RepID=A0A3P3FC90_9HYPH|nr:helix-turn-helix domain-containing protein [Mesorhizobium tamadayense]RRH95947.1 transcriptional regulator [Mesorhizobium tamadayense]
MSTRERSGCPISLSLELIGDRWTLLIIRDLVFAGKRHFREFLQSDEGISSRTLAERLQTLQGEGILTRSDDPTHGLKAIYRLTEAGIDLLPVLATLGAWGSKYRKADDELARVANDLAAGGEPALAPMKEKLRAEHLGRASPADRGEISKPPPPPRFARQIKS